MDLTPRRQGCPKVAKCSRIRDKGGPGQTSGAEGSRDMSRLMEDETTSQLLPCAIGTEPGRPKKREPRPWTDRESLGLCCREARSKTKPSGLLFASQRVGLKAIPIIPQIFLPSPESNKTPLTTTSSTSFFPTCRRSPSSASIASPPCCIFNQFFVHSHSLHPRPISGFFFHRRCSGDTSCENETPAYAPFNRTDHALLDPTLSFFPDPITAFIRGLLCCCGHISNGYYVCNPTTTA